MKQHMLCSIGDYEQPEMGPSVTEKLPTVPLVVGTSDSEDGLQADCNDHAGILGNRDTSADKTVRQYMYIRTYIYIYICKYMQIGICIHIYRRVQT